MPGPPGMDVVCYNTGTGRDWRVVRQEVRALLAERPDVLVLLEATAYPLWARGYRMVRRPGLVMLVHRKHRTRSRSRHADVQVGAVLVRVVGVRRGDSPSALEALARSSTHGLMVGEWDRGVGETLAERVGGVVAGNRIDRAVAVGLHALPVTYPQAMNGVRLQSERDHALRVSLRTRQPVDR